MNRQEAIQLAAYVQQLCPAQEMGEATGLAWYDVLSDLPFDIAKIAAAEVKKTSRWIDPADIRIMVKRLRRLVASDAERRFDNEDDTPPAEVRAYLDWMQQRRHRIRQYADQAITAREYDPRLLAIEVGDAA